VLDVESVRQMVMDAVPFNRVLGVRVEQVEPESVTLTLPEAPERLNHVGTMHAAAQFGLGEATAGTMTLVAFSDLQRQGYAPVVTDATVSYRKPASGELRGVATLSAEEQAHIRNEIAEGRRPRFTIAVQLFNQRGAVTTELRFEWVLLTPRGVKA
jgi:acyl-coenzyme A thioesterase PaaI-like protein